jgi:DNA-binding response OmpR family regulator
MTAAPSTKPLVLAVDDEEPVRRLLTDYLQRLGYEAITVKNGAEAIDQIGQRPPDVVMTDILMQPMSGLELVRRLRTEHPDLGIVVFTGYSSEEMVIEALRAGATDFLKKPFTMRSLDRVIQSALRFSGRAARTEADVVHLIGEEKRMRLPNDPELITGAINQLLQNARKVLNREHLRELNVALYEVILNAMEHGNLEISREEKANHLGAGDYLAFLKSRMMEDRVAQRGVDILYRMDRWGLHFEIKDQGPGFDWKKEALRQCDLGGCLDASGRGLILARFYVDRMEFNDAGNTVHLTVLASFKEREACST